MTAPQIVVTVACQKPEALPGLLMDLSDFASNSNETVIIVLSHDPNLVDDVLDLARGRLQQAVLAAVAQSASLARMAAAINLNPPAPEHETGE